MITRLLIVALLGTLLLIAYIAHPASRRFYEGFDLPNFSQPSIDLSKNADFMTFLQFNQQVCTMWEEVLADIMKNDQVSQPVEERLPKEQYVLQLEQGYSALAKFVKCQPFDQTSTLSVLLAAIPESTQVYNDTFAFLNKEISDTLEKLHSALDSANVSVSAFANYEPFEDCKAAVAAATAAKTSPSVQDLQLQQQQQTSQVLARVRAILIELPTLKIGLQAVVTKYNELKRYKERADSGDIVNDIT
jgi:hypothetical protein